MSDKITERDREATERRLLESVGDMIRENGFEKIGVNAVAARSGVSKILIYRYFGSLEGLLAAYIRRYDFWINFSLEIPDAVKLPAFLKKVFRDQIGQLHDDPVLKRLYRWELSTNNELTVRLREQREKTGMDRIRQVCERTGFPETDIAVLATFLTASITYLVLLEEFCPVYNGIRIGDDSGWERICEGVDLFVDRMFGA